jgi:hypothetical protein
MMNSRRRMPDTRAPLAVGPPHLPAVGIWSPCRIRACERRHDPAMRWIVGRQSGAEERGFAESDGAQWLAAPKNFAALADLSGQWIDLVHGRRPPRGIVLDMDLSVSPAHGEQKMSVWNGHTLAPAITRCSCSTSLATSNAVLCVPATCTALTAGTTCSSPSWHAARAKSHASIFEQTRPLQSTSFWRRSGSNTRSGYRPTRFCRAGSADDLRTMCAGSMPIQLSGRNRD